MGRYRFDRRTGRYRDPRGRVVSPDALAELLSRRMEAGAERIGEACGRLAVGRTSVADWTRTLIVELRRLHVTAAALGYGGWGELTEPRRVWVRDRLRSEVSYLLRFARQIASGEVPVADEAGNPSRAFAARAAMYCQSTHATWQEARREQQSQAGRREERNVLTAVENCDGCVSETARGWVPLGSLRPVGARDCLTNCRCLLEFR